jgi:hypothetical protein
MILGVVVILIGIIGIALAKAAVVLEPETS